MTERLFGTKIAYILIKLKALNLEGLPTVPKVLIAKLNGREIARYILSADNFFHIKAESGFSYEVINEKTDVLNKKVKTKVEDDSLVLMLEGEVLAVIDDFYHVDLDVRFESESEVISNHPDAEALELPPRTTTKRNSHIGRGF